MERPPVLMHMLLRAPLASLLFASLLLSPLSHGSDCDERIPLPERPLLESYTDYSAFIVDIMNFKRIEERHIRHREQCPSLYGSRANAHQDENADTRTLLPSPTLGDALAEASRRPPFDYQRHTTWYDRSTSRSFFLLGLSGTELASQRLRVGNADTPLQLPASAYVKLPENWRGDDLERVVARLREGRQQDELLALYDQASGNSLPLASVVVQGNLIFYLDLNSQLLGTEGVIYGCMACAPGS